MLIKCPECDLQLSNKAYFCPHCGYPMSTEPIQRPNNHKKHMRLPNGFGQITKIKNVNLRNRYRAMITVGKTPEGKPICKLLKPQSYFATYNDAYSALVEYNRNPYDLSNCITVSELYDRWSEKYYSNCSPNHARVYKAAWAYCSSVYNMNASDIRARHIKGCIDNGVIIKSGQVKEASAGIKTRIKSLFNLLFDYAVEYEIVDKNYSRTFDISSDIIKEIEDSQIHHIIFSNGEITTLWDNVEKVPYADIILYNCYSGWRPQEIGEILISNVDLDKNIIVGGLKTNAGKNRIVPIHHQVKPIIEKRYKESLEYNSPYLFTYLSSKRNQGLKMTYTRYRQKFENVINSLNLNANHRPHDCRKQFITKAKEYNMDEYALKRIVGHEINDITEKIYTDRSTEWLISEIEKIS